MAVGQQIALRPIRRVSLKEARVWLNEKQFSGDFRILLLNANKLLCIFFFLIHLLWNLITDINWGIKTLVNVYNKQTFMQSVEIPAPFWLVSSLNVI